MEIQQNFESGSDRKERFELHLLKGDKDFLAAAAKHERLPLGTFMLQQALNRAREVLGDQRKSTFDKEDVAAMVQALMDPTPPKKALVDLFRNREVYPGSAE